jgi:hypothetical protein
MRFFFVFFFSIFSTTLFAQQKNKLVIHHLFTNKALVFNENFVLKNEDTISINTFKYYISSIQFLKNKKVVWKEKNSVHLIDEENSNSKTIDLAKIPTDIDFEEIRFNIGIDSATNYAGVQGGDLDPTKGMYWTWQNGYINFKIEGKSTFCRTRNNAFQFHIGGYENGLATLQKIALKINQKLPIEINLDIEKLIEQLNFSTQNEIMQPCKEAVEIANKLPLLFSIQ